MSDNKHNHHHDHDHDHDHHHHHDHDHDHDHDHHHDVVLLTDEDGNEREFHIVESFEYKDNEYVVLVSNDSSQEGIILRVQVEDDMEYLVDIEDEDEWNEVIKIYEGVLEQGR